MGMDGEQDGAPGPAGATVEPKVASWHMRAAEIPHAQRFEAWRAWNARACDMLPFEAQASRQNFHLSCWSLADLIVCRSGSTGYRAARRATHIRGHRQHWLRLRVMERGHAQGLYGGQPGRLGPGDVQIVDMLDEYRTVYGESEYMTVFLPRELVAVSAREMAFPRTLPAQSPVARVLADATRSLVEQMPAVRAADSVPLAAGFAGLLSGLVLGGAVDEPAQAALRQSRRQAIEDYIERHLREPDLDIAELSYRFGASRATIYRMFADEGGVHAYLLRRRLEQTYRDLVAQPPSRGIVRTVREKWGFFDHSHFTRAFRERFGLSPSDAALLGTASGDLGAALSDTGNDPDRSLSTPTLFLQM